MRYSIKTKPWIITISVGIIVFVYFLLIWLLLGEINLLDKMYLVPNGGQLWHGIITNDNIPNLINKYGMYANLTGIEDWIGKDTSITSNTTIFNNFLLIYLFAGILLSIIYPLIFKLLRIGNHDIIPFSLTGSVICFIFIITGLIPMWNTSDFWRELVRILISCVCGLIVFFISNPIVNHFFVTSDNGQMIANELKSEKKQADKYNNDLRIMIDNYHKDNDKDYVDLDDVDKK